MGVAPAAKTLWQIVPRRPHAELPDHGCDEKTIAQFAVAADRAGTARQQMLDPGELVVSQCMAFQRLMADHGVVCSMSRSGNVWDNAAMESFFSSLTTERTARRIYRTRDEAKADVFDYIERFYNPKRRHSTIGYLSPMEFERQAGLA